MLLKEKHWEIVQENENLVKWMVGKNFGYNHPEFDDLVSEGKIGLTKAAASFDETKNIKFATYASRCIMNEIFMYHRKNKKHEDTISIHQPLNTDAEGNDLTLDDVTEDPNSDFLSLFLDKETNSEMIYYLLNYLSSQSRIIMIYYLAEKTQREVGEILNLSQSYMSRIIKRSTKKIKEAIDSNLKCNEKFSVQLTDKGCNISFVAESSEELRKFSVNFLNTTMNSCENLNFRLICKNKHCTLQVERTEILYKLLAIFIKVLDDLKINICEGNLTIPKNN